MRASGRKDGKGLSPRSVRYVHTIVHGALGYALRKGLVTRNVANAADAPTSRAARAPSGWSPEDVRAFLDSVRDDRLYAMWLLLATTGMRRGEVLALNWPSIDLDAARLSIRRSLVVVGYQTRLEEPKTESGRRTIPLDPYTVSVLRELRRRQAEERLALGPAYADEGLLFCREDGAALHPTACRSSSRRLRSGRG